MDQVEEKQEVHDDIEVNDNHERRRRREHVGAGSKEAQGASQDMSDGGAGSKEERGKA